MVRAFLRDESPAILQCAINLREVHGYARLALHTFSRSAGARRIDRVIAAPPQRHFAQISGPRRPISITGPLASLMGIHTDVRLGKGEIMQLGTKIFADEPGRILSSLRAAFLCRTDRCRLTPPRDSHEDSTATRTNVRSLEGSSACECRTSENVVYSQPAHEEGCGGRKPWAFKTDDIAELGSAAQTPRLGLHGSCQFENIVPLHRTNSVTN